MTFGEKLYKLRKGNGLSQDALAEQLNTTRQAVSKWENNQGYPETEKLIMLSSIFGVSIDSLLKEHEEAAEPAENGYYVSRECAERFLAFHRKTTMRTAIGVAVLLLAGVPYFLFQENQILSSILTCAVLLIGFAFILSMTMMGNPYKKLKRERLLFDGAYFRELTFLRERQKKQSFAFILLGVTLALAVVILDSATLLGVPSSVIQCILAAPAAYLFIYAIGIMDTYDILIRSEERLEALLHE